MARRGRAPWNGRILPSGLPDWLQSLPDAEQATAPAGYASRKKAVSLPPYGFGVGPTPSGWAESSTYFP